MKMNLQGRFLAMGLLLGVVSTGAFSQTSEVPAVAPFAGEAGYQEIRIDSDNWYLAFHGTRKHAIGMVQAAWLARAGQLCESVRKPYLVELRYVGERVFDEDPVALNEESLMLKVAGPVYIPMFIPSGPRSIPSNLTPTKSAAVRCVDRNAGLRAGRTAVSVADSQEEARKAGVSLR